MSRYAQGDGARSGTQAASAVDVAIHWLLLAYDPSRIAGSQGSRPDASGTAREDRGDSEASGYAQKLVLKGPQYTDAVWPGLIRNLQANSEDMEAPGMVERAHTCKNDRGAARSSG